MTKIRLKPKQLCFISMLLFWMITAFDGYAQTKVSGHIVSKDDNQGLPGASVMVKGTQTGTVTDLDGNFTINATQENDSLVFTMVGMQPQTVAVGGRSVIHITMESESKTLEEIIVIGYGTVKKSDLTGTVSTVNARDMTSIPVTNALESLQGKVAGLDLTKSSGQPGAKLNLTIRGNRSILANNNPLILVDGLDYGASLDINPNDIQSVEILRDEYSIAIYGSRGANGVILITTKRGATGKTKVTLNSYAGTTTVSNYPEFTNGPQWMALRREANLAGGSWKSPADDKKIFNKYALDGDFVDWRKLLIHDGNLQNHQININGGNEKTSYYLSIEYNEEQGILKFDNLKRFGGRLTLDHKINEWTKIGASIFYANTNQNKRANPFNQANKIAPIGFPFDTITGQINPYPVYDGNTLNPLIEEAPGVRADNKLTNRFFSTNYIQLQIIKGLTFKSTFGIDIGGFREGIYNGALSFLQNNTVSLVSVQDSSYTKLQWENILTFNKTLGIHDIELMAGTTTIINKGENYTGQGKNLLSSAMEWYALQNTSDSWSITSNYVKSQMVSFFGRVNYKLLNKYLLTTTLRWDGASQLASGHKGQFFPSIALAWKLKEEKFLKYAEFISTLKLRASYGLSGNYSVAPYMTQGPLGQTVYSFGETSALGYYPEFLPNKNLKWETTAVRDLGLDFGFFNNRFTGSLVGYYENTYDLLLYKALPFTSGYPGVTDNVGQTQNKGIELNISSVNVSSKNLKWITDFNFAMNREKIVKLANGQQKDVASGLFVGQPVKVFYDYEKIGIWQRADSLEALRYNKSLPGNIRLKDVNNDTLLNDDDKMIRGHQVPNFTMGMNNTISFKGLELSFFIYARIGQTINYEGYTGWKYAGDANTTIVDYWTPTNPTNFFPRPGNGSAGTNTKTYISTLGYVDGSYVKIRDITLAYTIPGKWTGKLNISRFRLYSTLKNYLTFSKIKNYDPERGGNLSFPMTKQWIAGINVEF